MIGCLPTQALAFLAVFVYATHTTHGTQAIAFEWKPGFTLQYFSPPYIAKLLVLYRQLLLPRAVFLHLH